MLKFFLAPLFVLLVSCQHHEHAADEKKPDLSKAALFNMQLGLGYLQQGDRPRAKTKLVTALEQEPKSPEINAAMAYYFEQTKELDQAKKYYLNALTLSKKNGPQLNNYGAFLCRRGDYINAERYFLKAVNDPQYVHTAGAYENAGLCALAIPDSIKAKHYFIQALNQDPSRRESLYELSLLELKEGHQKRALYWLQRYPELLLKDNVLLNLAEQCAQASGQNTLAAEYRQQMTYRSGVHQ